MSFKSSVLGTLAAVGKTATVLGTTAVVTVTATYTMSKVSFNKAKEIKSAYISNATIDEKNGITMPGFNISSILNSNQGLAEYLSGEGSSIKEEQLKYLINAELVTQFPYIKSLAGDDTKVNGIIRFYRYTNEIEGEEALEGSNNQSNLKNVFYMGDSWMEDLSEHRKNENGSEYQGDDYYLCKEDFDVSDTENNVEENIGKVQDNLSAIVIMLGLDNPAEDAAAQASQMISSLSGSYGGSIVYFVKAPYVGEEYVYGEGEDEIDAREFNRKIDKFNSIISQHCAGIGNVRFIDATRNLLNDEMYLDNQYLVSPESKELNGAGLALLNENINKCIQRGREAADLGRYEMIYVNEQEFERMLKNDGESNGSNIYKYFTINKNQELVIAYGGRTTQTIETDDPEKTLEAVNDGSDTQFAEAKERKYKSTGYSVQTLRCNYKAIVSQYVMPFNLLTALLATTNSYSFVKSIADIAYTSQINVAIYDNENISINVEEKEYNKLLRYTENTDLSFPGIGETDPVIYIYQPDYNSIVKSCHGEILSQQGRPATVKHYDCTHQEKIERRCR